MTADDPRHGTPRGYRAGCRDACCRRANTRRKKSYLLRRMRGDLTIDPIGTVRRVQALMALGWTARALAPYLGWSAGETQDLVRGTRTWLSAEKARRVARVYDQVSMTRPEGWVAERQRRVIAGRNGWPPPLAWDDIDDPDQDPTQPETPDPDDPHDVVDQVVVQRILDGDLVPANPAERLEVTRRWQAAGRSLKELERLTGWNSARYTRAA